MPGSAQTPLFPLWGHTGVLQSRASRAGWGTHQKHLSPWAQPAWMNGHERGITAGSVVSARLTLWPLGSALRQHFSSSVGSVLTPGELLFVQLVCSGQRESKGKSYFLQSRWIGQPVLEECEGKHVIAGCSSCFGSWLPSQVFISFPPLEGGRLKGAGKLRKRGGSLCRSVKAPSGATSLRRRVSAEHLSLSNNCT